MFAAIVVLLIPAAAFGSLQKCYSCSSANFNLRWPKDKNNSALYLREYALISNETCDSVRTALPVVPCENSVCVKFVLHESSSNRAVCSSLQSPIIVRDCWSRVLHSEDSILKFRPLSDKPVRLSSIGGKEQTAGQIFTCSGYLCNGVSTVSLIHSFILPILLFLYPTE